MDDTTLLLVRHGATEWNLRRPYVLQGRTIDAPLADLGVRQADAAAAALAGRSVAAIYSSPFLRARQTAERIAAPHHLYPVELSAIGEIDIGRWEGLTWDQARAESPEEAAAFEQDAALHGYLGGENFRQLRDRTTPALEALAGNHPGQVVVVVAHNVVNRVVMAHWLGLPLAAARRLPQANGAYNIVSLTGSRAFVRTINVVEHLSGLTPAD